MPCTCTRSYGKLPSAQKRASTVSLCAVSKPPTSRVGGSSAYPSACASARACAYSLPCSICVMMYRHVPFSTACRRSKVLARSTVLIGPITGVPAITDAS